MSEIVEIACDRCRFRCAFAGFWESYPVPRGYYRSLCLACLRHVIVGHVWDSCTENYDKNIMQLRRVSEASRLPQIIQLPMFCNSHEVPPETSLLYHHGADRDYELIRDLPQAPCPECGVVGKVLLGLRIGQQCPKCQNGIIEECV